MNMYFSILLGVSIIFFIWLLPYSIIIKKTTRCSLTPTVLLNSIWSIILVGTGFFSTIRVSNTTQIIMPIFWISILLFSIFIEISIGKSKPNYTKYVETLIKNKKKLTNSFIIGFVFGVIKIVYDYKVIGSLGGGLDQLSMESQWLRMSYLDYSRNEMSLSSQIISNILSYVSTIGMISACLLSFYDGKIWRILIFILLSVLGAVITMSKFSFILDLCYIFSIYIIHRNLKNNREKKKKKEKKRLYLAVVVTLSLIIILFSVLGTQRGYENRSSNIQGVDNIIVFEGIAYTITPYMAFQVLLDKSIEFSYGEKTFNPIFKLFGVKYSNFGAIDVGISDTTVYTMPGVFYADFGIIGSFLLMCLFILTATLLFRKVIMDFSISRLGFYMVINTLLLFSFFTWLGRMSVFWLFPIVLFIYDKIFIKYKS